jgi:zinc transporter ZupT
VALAVHSTTDGLALGIGQETQTTSAGQWSLFSALCIHKIPEGLALGGLLIGAGFPGGKALVWVAAVEATTLIGAAVGFFFLAGEQIFWLSLFMAHVAGGFLYLAAHAVLGEMLRHGKGLVLTSFALGVALIGGLNLCLRMLGS